jgi:hypothetical protein
MFRLTVFIIRFKKFVVICRDIIRACSLEGRINIYKIEQVVLTVLDIT